MATFTLLSQAEEDAIHKSRLLSVEERPFKRITKRLLASNVLLNAPSKLSASTEGSTEDTSDSFARQQLHDEIVLDFAAFDHSLARLHFLHTSNAAERERYAADRARILQTSQEVRASTAALRGQLADARRTLEQRKRFDELAEKITNNVLLRPRRDQEVNLRKLEEECRELERESAQYAATWRDRREQFGRIVEEGMQLRRLIRDEKDEVERREGMEEDEDGEIEAGARSPRGSSGGMTPRQEKAASPGVEKSLKPRPSGVGVLSRGTSRAPSSRPGSPAASERKVIGGDVSGGQEREVESVDTPMEESNLPAVRVEGASAQQGEDQDDKMDTT